MGLELPWAREPFEFWGGVRRAAVGMCPDVSRCRGRFRNAERVGEEEEKDGTLCAVGVKIPWRKKRRCKEGPSSRRRRWQSDSGSESTTSTTEVRQPFQWETAKAVLQCWLGVFLEGSGATESLALSWSWAKSGPVWPVWACLGG